MSFSDPLQKTVSLSVLASERDGTVRVVETRSVGYPLNKGSNSPTKKRSFQEVDLENGGTQKETKPKDKPIPEKRQRTQVSRNSGNCANTGLTLYLHRRQHQHT